jgi:hypothetical protein
MLSREIEVAEGLCVLWQVVGAKKDPWHQDQDCGKW